MSVDLHLSFAAPISRSDIERALVSVGGRPVGDEFHLEHTACQIVVADDEERADMDEAFRFVPTLKVALNLGINDEHEAEAGRILRALTAFPGDLLLTFNGSEQLRRVDGHIVGDTSWLGSA